jgi:hypothetical protein
MDKNLALELAAVTVVGFALAKGTQAVPYLNDNKVLTRTGLYVLGFAVAAYLRPQGGYKMLKG